MGAQKTSRDDLTVVSGIQIQPGMCAAVTHFLHGSGAMVRGRTVGLNEPFAQQLLCAALACYKKPQHPRKVRRDANGMIRAEKQHDFSEIWDESINFLDQSPAEFVPMVDGPRTDADRMAFAKRVQRGKKGGETAQKPSQGAI